ncbi:FliO/MopB family protein [Mariprofundus ferrooxydans]|nr:FliO/MopB family protein [Mariprofundus ferrooxydans]
METGMLSMLLQSLLGLAFVLGLFALLVWAARRLNLHQGGAVHGDFKIIQRMHLDSKNSIVEIRHKDKHYLLALSPGGTVQLRPEHALNSNKVTTE